MAADPPAARGEDNPSLRFDAIRARTPARILVGRAGSSYLTTALLDLRQDHAAALDAVRGELDLVRDLGPELIERFGLFEVGTQALSKREFLMRPDLGRQLEAMALTSLAAGCPRGATLQVAIGDGLSAAAVAAQVPALLPLLESGAKERGWSFGRPFVIRYCRVGVLNDIGERLDPAIVLLLVGERPGLSTSNSLSAYMAYRPRAGHTDANRNLISNIHAHGLPPEEAARQIFELATTMLRQETSGVLLGSSSTVASVEHRPPTDPDP
ncbi:ethanolamine ammonia-lyase subunit EutC [Singulisphaera acidiphila]|uniref:Ethanolamine ammonia-lyase small subunit n=1 Tax=Singulisphaera acidiphila (strain ATCC BAA-1392 / DSM 18658 / VKM B-2454 / MOB10) TaxID=886293 RepID=L0DKK4_SINAD|nr:ethanolamine ammonia-lyase subunit EutC [Singulisphaera acidiphila]AGA29360.1 ethanolamine ammonia-lyase, small subunit [Singulisphaera acidiphila DSM 18658]